MHPICHAFLCTIYLISGQTRAKEDNNMNGRTSKKVLSIILAAVMLLSLLPTFALADEPAAVCMIGTTEYASLAEAIAAVPADGTQTTITMIADETLADNASMEIAANKNIVLDLNGKTITGKNLNTDSWALLTNNGVLKITDGSTAKDGKITSSTPTDVNGYSGFYTVLNKNTLTLEAGTIEETSTLVGGGKNLKWALRNEASAGQTVTFNMTGGTVEGEYNAISNFVANNTSTCNVNISGGSVITNGRFSAMTVQIAGGDAPQVGVNISGGEFVIKNIRNTNANGNAIIYCDDQSGSVRDISGMDFSVTGGRFDTFKTPMLVEYDDFASGQETPSGYISGGLFAVAPATTEVALGFITEDNESSDTSASYPLVINLDENSVARIGTAVYTSLPEALSAAADGDVIVLLQNTTLAGGTAIAKSITLDLNGKELTMSSTKYGRLFVTNSATLTVDGSVSGSKFNGTLYASASDGATNGNLIITGGTYQAIDNTYGLPAVQTNGNATNSNILAIGATFIGNNANPANTDAESLGAYLAGSGTYIFTDCSITGAGGIYAKAGSLTLINTDVTAYGPAHAPAPNGSGADPTGDAVILDSNSGYKGNISLTVTGTSTLTSANGHAVNEALTNVDASSTVELTISGGTFVGASGMTAINTSEAFAAAVENKTATAAVSGGAFSSPVPAEYCAPGYGCTTEPDANGMYFVAVARIGDTPYATLAGAFAAANDKDTIVVLASVLDITETIEIDGMELTLDLNGGSVQMNLKGSAVSEAAAPNAYRTIGKAFTVGSGSKLTVENGTMSAVCNNGANGAQAFTVSDGGELVIASDAKVNGYDTVVEIVQGGSLTVNGSVHEINSTAYDGAKVNGVAVKGTAGPSESASAITINGNVDAILIPPAGGWRGQGTAIDSALVGTITVNDGATVSGHDCIRVSAGTLNIKGGEITACGYNYGTGEDPDIAIKEAVYVDDSKATQVTVNISGGKLDAWNGSAVVQSACAAGKTPAAITVTGGKFDVESYMSSDKDIFNASSRNVFTVSGGNFSKIIKAEYCAPGYGVTAIEDGRYTVMPDHEVSVINTDGTGDTSYMTLVQFRDSVNDGNSYAGKTVTLLKNVDLTGTEWTPIGDTPDHTFNGTFEGNGKTITGMTVGNTAGTASAAFGSTGTASGFFGFVNGGITVRNLTFSNVKVYAAGSVGVGALIGNQCGGTSVVIDNVKIASGTVIGKQDVGGVIGKCSAQSITITNCTNAATVTAAGNADYIKTIGGVAGFIQPADGNGTVLVGTCRHTGTVDGSANTAVGGEPATSFENWAKLGGVFGCICNAGSTTVVDCADTGYIHDGIGSTFLTDRIGIVCGTAPVVQGCTVLYYPDITEAPSPDDTYFIDYSSSSDFAAKVGNMLYPTLGAAFQNVQNGETIILLKSVTENVTLAAGKTATLDLNGQTITHLSGEGIYASAITVNGNLTLIDSADTGEITGNSYVNEHYWDGLVKVASGATFTMTAGTIRPTGGYEGAAITVYGTAVMSGSSAVTGVSATDRIYCGLIYVRANGVFTLDGGIIRDSDFTAASGSAPYGIRGAANSTINVRDGLIDNCVVGTSSSGSNGGAICSDGTVNISGGVIENCGGRYAGAVSIGGSGSLAFSGGIIRNCTSQYGGGITVEGTATISGTASITGCTSMNSDTNGSALRVNEGATVTMTGGTICGKNSGAVANSGTFYFNGGTITNENGRGIHTTGTFIMDGGTIENCTAVANNGGGVYVGNSPATFEMRSGTIRNCSATKNGENKYGVGGAIYSTGGQNAVIISGGLITGCSCTGENAGRNENGGSDIYLRLGSATITGGTFDAGTVCTDGNGSALFVRENCSATITGGSFGGTVYAVDAESITVSGGLYAGDPSVVTGIKIVDTYSALANGDAETKTAYPYEVAKCVATIGTTGYSSLGAALASAVSGNTVVLVENVQETSASIPAGVTLDLNRKTAQIASLTNNGKILVYDAETLLALIDTKGTIEISPDVEAIPGYTDYGVGIMIGTTYFFPGSTVITVGTPEDEMMSTPIYVGIHTSKSLYNLEGVRAKKNMTVEGNMVLGGNVYRGSRDDTVLTAPYRVGQVTLGADLRVGGDDPDGNTVGGTRINYIDYPDGKAIVNFKTAPDLNGHKIILEKAGIVTVPAQLVIGTEIVAGDNVQIIETQNTDGTYTYSHITAVACIGDTDYATLAEALNAAQTGDTVELLTDITLTGEWTPVGTAVAPFTATFDGRNHTISGLTVSNSTSAGLFGYVNNATVKNLTISGASITNSGSESNASFLIGQADNGATVINVTVDATSTILSTAKYIGGLVCKAPKGNLHFTNCAVNGSLSTGEGTNYRIGGYICQVGTGNGACTFTNCTFGGQISTPVPTPDKPDSKGWAGGFIAQKVNGSGLGSLYTPTIIKFVYCDSDPSNITGTNVGAYAGNVTYDYLAFENSKVGGTAITAPGGLIGTDEGLGGIIIGETVYVGNGSKAASAVGTDVDFARLFRSGYPYTISDTDFHKADGVVYRDGKLQLTAGVQDNAPDGNYYIAEGCKAQQAVFVYGWENKEESPYFNEYIKKFDMWRIVPADQPDAETWTDSCRGEATWYDELVIDGGLWAADPTAYLAPGYTATLHGDYYVVDTPYAAVIGDTAYDTLQEALAAAAEGQTVKLLKDVTESVLVRPGKVIVLDMNGHSLTESSDNTVSSYTIDNQGILTITGNGKLYDADDGDNSSLIRNLGTLTIENGEFECDYGCNVIKNDGDEDNKNGENVHNTYLTINGGTFKQNKAGSDYQVILSWTDITINGGTFTGNGSAGASVIMSGGDSSDPALGKLTVNGGTFGNADNAIFLANEYGDAGDAVITGGTFNGALYVENDNGTIAVTGGEFDRVVPETYCAEGYEPVEEKNEDGMYTVQIKEDELVAMIGETPYFSFADALAAAKEGDTIKLMYTDENAAEGECADTPFGETALTVNRNITIDLNGRNLVIEEGVAFTVAAGTTLTVIDSNYAEPAAENNGENNANSSEANSGTAAVKLGEIINNGTVQVDGTLDYGSAPNRVGGSFIKNMVIASCGVVIGRENRTMDEKLLAIDEVNLTACDGAQYQYRLKNSDGKQGWVYVAMGEGTGRWVSFTIDSDNTTMLINELAYGIVGADDESGATYYRSFTSLTDTVHYESPWPEYNREGVLNDTPITLTGTASQNVLEYPNNSLVIAYPASVGVNGINNTARFGSIQCDTIEIAEGGALYLLQRGRIITKSDLSEVIVPQEGYLLEEEYDEASGVHTYFVEPDNVVVATYCISFPVSGGGSFAHGENVTVTAEDHDNYTFDGWFEYDHITGVIGKKVSNDLVYTFAAADDIELYAGYTVISTTTMYLTAAAPSQGGTVSVQVWGYDPAQNGAGWIEIGPMTAGGNVYSVNFGDAYRVTYSAYPTGYEFDQWENEYGKALYGSYYVDPDDADGPQGALYTVYYTESNCTIEFRAYSDMTVAPKVKPKNNSSNYMISWVNGYDQTISRVEWNHRPSKTEILNSMPDDPVMTGYEFKGWTCIFYDEPQEGEEEIPGWTKETSTISSFIDKQFGETTHYVVENSKFEKLTVSEKEYEEEYQDGRIYNCYVNIYQIYETARGNVNIGSECYNGLYGAPPGQNYLVLGDYYKISLYGTYNFEGVDYHVAGYTIHGEKEFLSNSEVLTFKLVNSSMAFDAYLVPGPVMRQPTVSISSVATSLVSDPTRYIISFTESHDIPSDCTVLEHGIVRSVNQPKITGNFYGEDLSGLVIDAEGTKKFASSDTLANSAFTVNINMSGNQTYYAAARAYLIYTDAFGEKHTIYSEPFVTNSVTIGQIR